MHIIKPNEVEVEGLVEYFPKEQTAPLYMALALGQDICKGLCKGEK